MAEGERLPQHLRALARANETRLLRAEVKRAVGTGELGLAEALALAAGDARLGGMPVLDLLMAQRRWGRTRSVKLVAAMRLGEQKPLGELTERQMTELVDRVAGRPPSGVPLAEAPPVVESARDRAARRLRPVLEELGRLGDREVGGWVLASEVAGELVEDVSVVTGALSTARHHGLVEFERPVTGGSRAGRWRMAPG
jgi:hypothetical protein